MNPPKAHNIIKTHKAQQNKVHIWWDTAYTNTDFHIMYFIQVIVLTFTSFDLESHSSCNYDHVTVYDGNSASETSFGELCGSNTPQPMTTTGNAATVHFESDGSITGNGFSFTYNAVDGTPEPTAGPAPGSKKTCYYCC